MADLLIKNGTVVTQDGQWAADVLVQDGKIAGVVAPGTVTQANRVIDAKGLHVLPGVIDPHTHLPNRGRTYPVSCDAFSRTQVSGGTTSALSFIFSPESSFMPVLEEMAAAVRDHSIIDMGASPILDCKIHIAEIPEMAQKHGIMSFKAFPFNFGSRGLYPKTNSLDDGLMWAALRALAKLDPQPILQIHPENHEIVAILMEEVKGAGRMDAPAWTEARPNLVEEDALNQFIFWVRKAGATGYGVHLTTKEAPVMIAKARAKGIKFYAETCPQYLTCWDTHPAAAQAKYQPAIKSKSDVDALWAAIANGTIHTIGSDHIPITMAEKNLDKDIWNVALGTPNSGTILPVLLSYGVSQGRISLSDVVRVSSYNVARVFGLYPQKGCLLPGADADLVLVDLKKEVKVTAQLLNVDFTLHEGETFKGWPRTTIVSGRPVMEDGKLLVPVSGGRMLKRRRLPSVV